ncbi:Inactive rhomboid protein 1 [Seminavis robusta]|uniref:rhomboid protease n=1 Tax=Seminavis robusta TaxID=568900 RepID=A0A9N8HUN2_9STRA|nr:Inactive rhomboid protein 1 [Seminavis robusta]|eukprot:Sro1677_g290540.1 Inactive rhomboid protein 1 (526) ;mRNA; f:3050-4814
MMNPLDLSCAADNVRRSTACRDPEACRTEEELTHHHDINTGSISKAVFDQSAAVFDPAQCLALDKSLFDETLEDQESSILSEDEQERGKPWLGPEKNATSPLPIPIQHVNPMASSLQRPAVQFADTVVEYNDEEDLEVGKTCCNSWNRPNSIGDLVTAIRNRQVVDRDGSVERRIQDFERARTLRQDKYRASRPWGILGMFDHLSGIRDDLQWAEHAAARRAQQEPYVGWADYMKDHERNYHRLPVFVIAVTIISTVMFIYTMSLADWKFAPPKVNPMIGPPPEALLEAGALNSYLVVVEGQWWRLFAPLVLHAGIIHFVFNMLAIWFIGGPLEKIHGSTNVGCLFVISAVGGNVLSAALQPNVISVGASGGIFGLVGVCLADIFVNWDLLFLNLGNEDERTPCNNIQVLFWLLFDVLVNFMLGLTPFIDNFAHMGGLFYGIFYALPLVDRLGMHFFGQLGFCFKLQNCSLRAFGFMAGCTLLLVSSLLLLKSDGYSSPCERCRFISCAPFPFWKEEKWWDCSLE